MKKLLLLVALVGVVFAGNITPRGMKQGDLYTLLNNMVQSGLYYPLNSAVVAVADDVATLNTTVTVNFVNDGIFYTKAPSANFAPLAVGLAENTFTRSARITSVNYGIHVNAAGNFAANRSNVNEQPGYIPGYTPIAVIEVGLKADNTAGFKLGTTKWNAASQNVVVRQVAKFNSGPNKLSLTDL